MIERFRNWLYRWLGVDGIANSLIQANNTILDHGQKIFELRAEVTRLSIAQYVPPSQPEPERKVIKTQTFKQYMDIVEQEQESLMRREEDAVR